MTLEIPVLGINIQGLNKNLQNVGENRFSIPGTTPKNFEGFGQVQNMSNTDDVAYFFADYAKDVTNMNGPACNLQITTDGQGSGGRKLIDQIVTRAGDDFMLAQDELQNWADEVGYTGDLNSLMEAMANMDDFLCGKGTLDLEYLNPEETTPSESTEPTEENDQTDPKSTNDNENPSLKDLVKGAIEGGVGWMVDGLLGLGKWLLG